MSAGLYIHIPFCKSRCIYCDFYSQTEIQKENYIRSLLAEAEYYSDKWVENTFNSLYFGGGTPSLLTPEEISLIVNFLKSRYHFSDDVEITLECNPDDIDEKYSSQVAATGINRISIGVQSFENNILRFLSRRHNAEQTIRAVEHFQKAGIENINIDLIFGIPGLTPEAWQEQLKTAVSLHVKHISAYMLTSYENTKLCSLNKQMKIQMPGDEDCFIQFCKAGEYLSASGMPRYEISNYAVPGYESRHNQKYWKGKPWLGLGPSAHTYTKNQRSANPADNDLYLRDTVKFISTKSTEILDEKAIFNEYIMNHLRTLKGINTEDLKKNFPQYFEHFNRSINMLKTEWYKYKSNKFYLSEQGLFVSDYITSKLFL